MNAHARNNSAARTEMKEKILRARAVMEQVKAEKKAELVVLIAEREKIEAEIKALTSPKVVIIGDYRWAYDQIQM
jgi:cell division protein FtsB